MYQFLRTYTKKIIPDKYHTLAANVASLSEMYGKRSYSQEGEDILIKNLFPFDYVGFYVDVGAYHPMEYSNTYYFYRRGWRGINIDAMPGSMNLFRKHRKRDINLELAIADEKKSITYHQFNDPALNTFSEQHKEAAFESGKFHVISTVEVQTSTLEEVFNIWLPANTMIDLLDIDVEGYDLKVLRGNNWEKHRPKIILVESLRFEGNDNDDTQITNYLSVFGYLLIAKTIRTLIFIDPSFGIKIF
jgi:FkbM family methyltransferase